MTLSKSAWLQINTIWICDLRKVSLIIMENYGVAAAFQINCNISYFTLLHLPKLNLKNLVVMSGTTEQDTTGSFGNNRNKFECCVTSCGSSKRNQIGGLTMRFFNYRFLEDVHTGRNNCNLTQTSVTQHAVWPKPVLTRTLRDIDSGRKHQDTCPGLL